MNCQSVLGPIGSCRNLGAFRRKTALKDGSRAPEERLDPAGQCGSRVSALDQAVRRGPPRALADAGSSPPGHSRDQLLSRAGGEDAALLSREPPSGDPLHLGERCPEAGKIYFDQRRQELHEHQVGDPLHLAIRRVRQLFECAGLGGTTQAPSPRGDGQYVTPLVRYSETRQKRRDALRLGPAAAFYDEAAQGKGPGANGGTLASTRRLSQLEHVSGYSVDL